MPDADLIKFFDQYSADALVQMASFIGVLPQKQRSKSVLSNLIIERIGDPNYLKTAVNSLSKGERAALDAIVRREGRANIRDIRMELAKLSLIDPNARVEFGAYSRLSRPNPDARDSKRLEDLLIRLMLRGLVFAEEMAVSPYGYQSKRTFYDSVQTLYIPKHIQPYLPDPQPLPQIEYPLEVKRVQEGSARLFQRDLYLYWGYVRDHHTPLTKRDEIFKPALMEINGVLQVREMIKTGKTENDYPRMRFMRGMLEALNLLRAIRFTDVEVSGNEDFFAETPDERVRRAFQAWCDMDQFSEILLLPDEVRPKGNSSTQITPARKPVIRARKYVLEQLGKLVARHKADSWISLANLVDIIHDFNYEFFLPRNLPTQYYTYPINPYDYTGNELGLTFPGLYREDTGWAMVEANLIRGVVTGPLYWMGLVDLGYEHEDAPAAFRLTPLGAWLFQIGPKPEIPIEGGRVIVQPNMQIMALDPIQDAVLATLDRFAERLSAERAVEYRLTRVSVYAGQQAGWNVPRIKEALQQYSGSELPGNVSRTLDEWQAQFERITIHSQVVLVHGSSELLDRLSKDEKTAGLFLSRPLAEAAILTNAQAVSRVTRALYEQEILPVVNRQVVVPPGSVTALETGELRLTIQVPSLYLHGHLAAFADPFEGEYRITPASVQRAARSGLSAPEIIQRLEAVHSGPVPERLARSILAWTKHYGSANLAPVTLLQMRDEATMEELLADPEIAPLLKRIEPKQSKAMARVKSENVEKLRRLLIERGVDLQDHIP